MSDGRRILTRPSSPALLPWDNIENDLIVGVNDEIGDKDNMYKIVNILGRGAYGQVVGCYDIKTREFTAIKISKSPRPYYECAKNEVDILKRLQMLKSNLFVNYKHDFIFKQHLCVVLEKLDRNLYEFSRSKKFQGCSHAELKTIANQLVQAMIEMFKIGLVHCDIKPENILLSQSRELQVKLIDFGSAFFRFRDKNHYVQSRFYRAPEVILKQSYSTPVDIWSFACVIFELFTGRALFPGCDNNDQLARIYYYFENDTAEIPVRSFDRDCYLTKNMAADSIKRMSDDTKNNNLLIDFIFFCLKLKQIDRPNPLQIILHPYLSEMTALGKTEKTEDAESAINRDLLHPPPVEKSRRRHTTWGDLKNKHDEDRKQSNF